MKLDQVDFDIIRILTEDGRASYSDISKSVGVSIGTVRNRITALRESGALHLNVWLDPAKVGLGVTTTFLLRVQAGALDDVVEAVSALDSTGYVAVIVGDHDLMIDVFCRDVPHLNRVLREEIRPIPGVESVTSYLVTEVRYDSSANMVDLLDAGPDADEVEGGPWANTRRSRSA